MEKIIIIGASGHAKVIIDAIELVGKYSIHGYIDSYKPKEKKILNYTILGSEKIIPELVNKGINKGIIAIGDNYKRAKMAKKILKTVPNFEFVSIIHPSAIISKYANIGNGSVILGGAIIDVDSKVGDFCIVNNAANLGHDSTMESYSSLAPNTSTGGAVFIGKYTAISIGANVLQSIHVGEHTIIGAGALVTNDIDSYKIAYGVPAKTIRDRKKGDSYLHHISTNTTFEVFNINDQKSLKKYKKTLKALKNLNPFYKTELLDTTNMTTHQLNYFVLKKGGVPIIVMPFYKRNITTKNTSTIYSDVISPYGYSGPLICPNEFDSQLLKHFWFKVDQWYKKENVISEFIRFSLNDNHKEYSGVLIPTLKNVKGTIINCKEQWDKFKSKVRNNYRKSTQQGLKIKIYQGEISKTIIEEFYNIYIETMKRNNAHEQYFHNITYFENFINNNEKSRIIATVYKDDIAISTELVLIGNNTLYSYLGGTVAEYFKTRPNDFLKIEVLNWARENNFKHYILGGGREDGDNLYKYKKTFFPNDDDAIYYTGRKVLNWEAYESLVEQKGNLNKVEKIENITQDFFPLYRQNE